MADSDARLQVEVPDFLKYLIRYALDHCQDDLEFLCQMYDKELIDRLKFVVDNDFVRLPYTEGVKILEESGHKFEYPVYWGADLQSEHERFLVEELFKKPVILTDYPKEIKAFYMKMNDDGKTVRAMDVLFPRIGEIIGGSQREENYDKLLARIEELHIPMKDMWWYLDTRRFGTAPHSGFGLGFERLLLFVTGMTNIRDVIPFPRTPKNADSGYLRRRIEKDNILLFESLIPSPCGYSPCIPLWEHPVKLRDTAGGEGDALIRSLLLRVFLNSSVTTCHLPYRTCVRRAGG